MLGEPVPWLEINRGGQATFHGPGQVVAYPIFDLSAHGKDVHLFLRNLEEVVIRTLQRFSLIGYRREGLTGVWVDNAFGEPRKIASIGIGVSRWISYHGLSLNVDLDLKYFRAISPCGQDGSVMTSVNALLAERGEAGMTIAAAKAALREEFYTTFSFDVPEGSVRDGMHFPRG